MDEFEFVLPLNKEDLRRSDSVAQYVVHEIFSPREIETKISELHSKKRSLGPDTIVDCFDVFYSIIIDFASLQKDTIRNAWDVAFTCVSKIGSELMLRLTGCDETLENVWKKRFLNRLRMCCYSLCQLTERIEAECRKPSTEVAVAKGRGRKKVGPINDKFEYWPSEKLRLVQCLQQLCELPLSRLWESQVVEQEFVNLVTNCCFDLTEDPDILKASAMKDSIFAVLGANIKKNSYGIACVLKMTQLLQHHEHTAVLFAEAVQVLVEKYECRSIVCDVVRELCHDDNVEPDSAGVRNTSVFLTELSNRVPHLLLNSVSLLVALLDVKSHTMRNGVLTALSKIVQLVLSSEDLDDKLKEVRDELLSRLQSHILDEHAFVRSKVLQIWQQLCTEQLIPLGYQRSLLQHVVERLLDKSSLVRKNALLFIGAFLHSNPFSAKLSVEELQKNLSIEQEKLAEIKKECGEDMDAAAACRAQRTWDSILPAIEKAYEEFEEGDDVDEAEYCKKTEEELQSYVQELLGNGSYGLAITAMKFFMQAFPESDLLAAVSLQKDSCDASEDGEGEDPDESRATNQKREAISLLKKVYHDPNETQPASGDKLTECRVEDANTCLNGEVTELNKQKILVQYLTDCAAFAEKIQDAIPVICKFLKSSAPSDVQEAMKFFVAAHQFGVKGTLVGIRHMLPLIWSKEAALRDAVVDAYRTVYLASDDGESKKTSVAVADKLSSLLETANLEELLSLEKLVTEFVKSGDISQRVIQILWQRFATNSSDSAKGQSLSAIRLLSMIASPENGMVKANLDKLITYGLNDRAKLDLDFCRHTCCALEKFGYVTKIGDIRMPCRLPHSHELFTALKEVLCDTFTDLETNKWIPTMEKAFDVIFRLCENPRLVSSNILHELTVQQVNNNKPSDVVQSSEEGSQKDSTDEEDAKSCSLVTLSRLLASVGYIAFRLLVYLDVDVFTDRKCRRLAKEERHKVKEIRKSGRRSFSAIDHGTPKRKEGGNKDEEGDESAGNAADDADAEFIIHLLDNEVLHEDSLLGQLGSFAAIVTSNPSKFKHVQLQMNASMALARLMLVSTVFCEKHLPLFFTILEKSPEPSIRANLVIAVGDLTLRFPNLIEPWTGKIYSRLGDSSIVVRKNVLNVLSLLILNDMIKVKGQISDLAVCITDKDGDISGITKAFFIELGKRGNALYNVLPDIISHLSDPEHGTDEENFRIILRFLFSNVDKERQLENFVEKLCLRFRTSETERQWRDLSFCISLIPFSEKGLRKLHENITCFGNKLHIDEVYDGFTTMLSNAKKAANLKAETKSLVEELEGVLEELRTKGCTEDELVKRAQMVIQKNTEEKQNIYKTPRTGLKSRTAAAKLEQSTKKAKAPRRKIMLAELNSSSEEHSDCEAPPQPTESAVLRRSRRHVGQAALENSDGSDKGQQESTRKAKASGRKIMLAELNSSSEEHSGCEAPSQPTESAVLRRSRRRVAQAALENSDGSDKDSEEPSPDATRKLRRRQI